MTTDRERFRLAREFEELTSVVKPCEMAELDEESVVAHDDLIIIRSKDRSVIDDVIKKFRCRIFCEDYSTIQYDDDKELFKRHALNFGIKVPASYSVDNIDADGVYFVKPNNLGDSIGIDEDALCYGKDEVVRKVNQIKDIYGCSSLIEEYLDGREYTVSVFKSGHTYQTAALEISSDGRFLSFDTKSRDAERYSLCDDDRIHDLAIQTFKAVGGKHIGRVDIREKNGIPYVMEINMIPGLSKDGYFYRCFKASAGMGHKDLLYKIFRL